MSLETGFLPFAAAEFPNDNPLLHEGVSWVCLRVSGPPRPVVRPRSVARAPESAPAPAETVAVAAETVMVAAETVMVEAAVPPVGELAPASVEAPPAPPTLELLPESVLGPLLESLDLALEQTAAALRDDVVPADETLELDALGPDDEAPISTDFDFDTEGTGHVAASPACMPAPVEALVLVEEPAVAPAEELAVVAAPAVMEALVLVEEPAVASAEEPAVAAAPAAMEALVLVEEPAVAGAPAVVEPTATEPDPHAVFVGALVEVAMLAGATRAAAVIPAFLAGATVDLGGFTEEVRRAVLGLRAGDAVPERGAAPADTLATAGAWRAVLRGETEDFSACGTSTLDGWAADLLRAFAVGQGTRLDVRRELRRRGVAAFGMLVAAA